ncbi:hypothetical protein [Tenggerimyces flavus]|uniref:Uncharacterized protein n=1 Tax=Tenggerimyces flavus TaxID=1708749 RepID=A0ABV7Y7R0_9ACTN|nr:hypothetical protein [Tenggerimyces flavus]MBM7785542.1 hypothetical protein [Tenggerimyces flavus]
MIPDSIVESLDKLLANSSEAPATRELVAHVLAKLADELPEHYGPGAQWAYRGWLRRRANALETDRAWTRTLLADTRI